ncbi:Alpha-1,4-glucan:maltose-1-phosphate maltosyltransferase [Flavobacterium bizetiae]|uniref:Alpha-1,4-glucan:maltose-1-phosphate maltosyltransferase n=1 Tax=Flavobacterium bizetiae TaxID=2704140 RepID=A0A6J4GSB4_9FLAO|nr:alpha-amylase family glycosyl hydrolase [Flavobacterium bizetiae]CAA9201161.1 Alpha-1,4-glucan:maltose-1-phosphate maltosyltransferase [Flavobacterium bizetiae]CAD5343735.1 Alpha-1,4-glucan:maltose-1-phosphate maltosyltransferase [Flavobacterium bizetiae]CAD5349897.1 Alpha-1,4-glucan:maltose-1-phosphate maltosyltransferase [Flavobacterium bizetiae]
MINKKVFVAGLAATMLFSACKTKDLKMNKKEETPAYRKIVVYQVFTRLFGNKNTTNKSWGTIEENGVGKFNDFTDNALHEIKDLGVTYIWYTGVPHHALVRDYKAYGISDDDPEVVKGRAGSPYAVKDYYNVNPDLALNPANRLQEFEDLIARTHKAGLKVIIDIVPNHIARKYEGKNNPEGVKDFGADDDVNVEYSRNNNFYYIPNSHFEIPDNDIPLNGEKNPLVDGVFDEKPAKWTGNGSRKVKPDQNDWYETVKVNYGVRPDGSKDFLELPAGFDQKSYEEHFAFWQDKDVPDSWKKFKSIALYWTAKGVDGFRYDMAEMVPYEFWSYMNSAIKMKNPNAFLLAEVYNPNEYRNYIRLGKMDYLYDKVETYDKLKDVIRGKSSPDGLSDIQKSLSDIEHNMLHFLDNHDEQRLASPEFAGTPERGKPLMVVSTTISTSPTMVYFGQEVGEAGNENAGFGTRSRTSIFDYIGVPNHQRWMNEGKFDGGKLSDSEKNLRDFYKRLLNFSINSPALMGSYQEIQFANRQNNAGYDELLYSYVRWSENQKLIVVANFSSEKTSEFELKIPADIISKWNLKDGEYTLTDQLYLQNKTKLNVSNGEGRAKVKIAPSESFIYEVK